MTEFENYLSDGANSSRIHQRSELLSWHNGSTGAGQWIVEPLLGGHETLANRCVLRTVVKETLCRRSINHGVHLFILYTILSISSSNRVRKMELPVSIVDSPDICQFVFDVLMACMSLWSPKNVGLHLFDGHLYSFPPTGHSMSLVVIHITYGYGAMNARTDRAIELKHKITHAFPPIIHRSALVSVMQRQSDPSRNHKHYMGEVKPVWNNRPTVYQRP